MSIPSNQFFSTYTNSSCTLQMQIKQYQENLYLHSLLPKVCHYASAKSNYIQIQCPHQHTLFKQSSAFVLLTNISLHGPTFEGKETLLEPRCLHLTVRNKTKIFTYLRQDAGQDSVIFTNPCSKSIYIQIYVFTQYNL